MATAPVVLPELDWKPTEAKSSRHGARVRLIVVHRWGVRYIDQPSEARSYQGVINEFGNPANQASAHIVYPGSAVGGGHRATQMVTWAEKAWTEAFYNPQSDEIESADSIWLGHDWYGFHVLARMVAKRLKVRGLPPVWVQGGAIANGPGGFCRHADLGALGGGHTQCPTTDLALWHSFVAAVQHEFSRGGFRPVWGR
jgi:hypothetical protein